jgi:hypothetical protein
LKKEFAVAIEKALSGFANEREKAKPLPKTVTV